MISVESYLRQITRRIAFVRGGARLVEPLRQHYVKRYTGTSNSSVVIEDFDGNMKLRIDRAAYMGSLIYWQGYHSYRELRCLDRLLTPSMVFVDVGANRGEFTVFAAKRLPRGRVLSFEPLPDNFHALAENIRLNDLTNVTAFPCGLAAADGELPIFTSNDLVAHKSWHEGLGTLYPTEYRAVPLGKVPLRTLDDVAADADLPALHCVKIDVEGAELPVLQGAAACLERFRPVLLLEMNRETFAAAGYTKWDVHEFLSSLGYQILQIARRGEIRPADIDAIPDLCHSLWMPPTGFSCAADHLERLHAN